MPKICFIEATAYSVLNPKTGRSSTGGEAVQHTLLAKEFARSGWDTSMVSLDIGQREGDVFDGVKVWKTYKQKSGLPYFRFFYPRLVKAWQALRKADADVYFQSCAGVMTGVVAKFVAKNNRKMIFRVAHDADCIPGEHIIKYKRDQRIYEYGLRRADLISVQSTNQADALLQNYGLKSVGVDMAAEIPDVSESGSRDIDVLWVNNFREFKRPELLIDIAKQLPDVSFAMIGGPMVGFEELFNRVRKEAEEVPNLNFVGAVPYSEVNAYFSRAKLFLNTSDSEGFPNSFLQAWVRGVPVISYFDPDGLIESLGLGVSVPSQDDFRTPIAELLASSEHREQVGEQARQYVIDRYSSEAIVKRYQELIDSRFAISL